MRCLSSFNREWLSGLGRNASALVIAMTVAMTVAMTTQATASPAKTPPNQAADTGTTHGVTLPGMVEVKGDAARPQHALRAPAADAASSATSRNTVSGGQDTTSAGHSEVNWPVYGELLVCRLVNQPNSDR